MHGKERVTGRAEYMAAHLALGLVAVVAVIGLLMIAQQVAADSALAKFDHKVATALHESATPGWTSLFRNVTILGTGWVLGIASGVVGLGLLLRRRFVLAAGWIIAQVGAVTLVKVIKALVERTRPGLTDFLASGWSFPSGHATRTAVFCGMIVYLAHRLTRSRTATVLTAVAGIIWSLLMAFSRVYLGAHFASDVVAGLLVAAAWLAVCIWAIEVALRRANWRQAITSQ
jgi:membrane-associated phospholipid phosphatase